MPVPAHDAVRPALHMRHTGVEQRVLAVLLLRLARAAEEDG